MAVTLDEIRRLTIVGRTEGVAAAEAELKRLSAAQSDVAATGETMSRTTDVTAKTVERAGRSHDVLAAGLDRAARSTAAMERGQKIVTAALDQGAVSAAAAARTLVMLADRHAMLAARFDPVLAASVKYRAELNDLREAHRTGVVSGAQLVVQENELRMAFERTTSALAARAATQKRDVERMVARQTIVPDRGADIAAYGTELDSLRAKFNPLWAAGQSYRRTVEEIARAERFGAISAAEAANARARARASTATEVEYLRRDPSHHPGGVDETGLSTLQRQMFMARIFNTVSSVGSGMPLAMVAMQQGTDFVQAFSLGPNGVGGTVKALTDIFAAWAPRVAAVAGPLTALITIGYGFVRFRSETEALAASLNGLGRASGETLSSLSVIAARGAAAGGLSLSSGRDAAATFAGAGLGGSLAEGLIGQSRAYARVTGTDLAEANKTLAAAFADPVKGAQQLGDALGFLDERTRVSIRSLVAQGDLFAGRKVLFDALSRDLAQAADRTSDLARAWEWLKRVGSNAVSTVGQTVDGMISPRDTGQRIRDLMAERAILLREARGRSDAMQFYSIGPAPGATQNASPRLHALETELEVQREIQRAEAMTLANRRQTAIDRQASGLSASYVNSVLPELERRRTLTDQITNLQAAMNDPARLAMMGMSVGQVTAAIGMLNDQLGQTVSALDKIRMEGDLALRGITARSVGDRALLARDRALGGVAMDAASPGLRDSAENASRLVLEQAKKDAEERLRAANDNARLAGLLSYPRQRGEIENRWARQNEVDAGSPTALAANAAARKAELDALARTSTAAPLDDANRSLEAQNRLLAVNAATFGLSTDRVTAARTAQEMLNQYIAAGVPITDQLRAGIAAYADGMGRAAQAAEDLDRRQKAVVQGMDDLRSMSKGVFSSLMRGDAKGALRLLGDRAIDGGAGFLTDQLFGKAGKPGGGLFGDALGGLFGKSQGLAVATQNVQAGIVNLSGGLPGLGGVAGGGGLGVPGLGAGAPFSAPGGSADYLGRMFRIESGGNPADRTGSNYGIAQFGYADMKRWGLADPFDVRQATTASLLEAKTNAAALGPVLGRDVTGADLYLAHQQGLAGAKALYQNPDMPAWSAIRPFYGSDDIAKRAITGNAGTLDMSSRQFTDMWASRYNATKPLDLTQINGAGQALQQFQKATTSATTDLGSFGDGLGKMGSSLFDGLTGKGGSGGGLFGSLFHLFGFAGGGIMSGRGPLPIHAYAGGGVARSPQLAVFAEAGVPEAFVPVPSGRIPVQLAGPMPGARAAAPSSTTVTIGGSTIVVQGSTDDATMARLRVELDRRDAAIKKHTADTILVQNRRAAGMRG